MRFGAKRQKEGTAPLAKLCPSIIRSCLEQETESKLDLPFRECPG